MSTLKNILIRLVDFLFFGKITIWFLSLYEHYVMYRIRDCWGKVHLRNIQNKGENVKIVGYTRILNPENLELSDNIRIGYNCFLFCKGGLQIGNGTILSRNITIYTSNHNYKGKVIPYSNEYIDKPVKIGSGVWIGMGVMIRPGVTIGDGAIIGMGTIVNRDVLPGEIVISRSHEIISKREMIEFERFQKDEAFFAKHWPRA